MDIEKIISDKRSCLAHIGMEYKEFVEILSYFETAYLSYKKKKCR